MASRSGGAGTGKAIQLPDRLKCILKIHLVGMPMHAERCHVFVKGTSDSSVG